MVKKRIMFTLFYDNGQFCLSRNFGLQKVGDISWVQNNLRFSEMSRFIDELIVLDVSRGVRNPDKFSETLKLVTKGCFVPVSAGGGVGSTEHARQLLQSGADKVVINSALENNPSEVKKLIEIFGSQFVVGSVDLKKEERGSYIPKINNGTTGIKMKAHDWIDYVCNLGVGELLVTSITQDGTGQGLDMGVLELFSRGVSQPTIIAGGVGTADHLLEGLADPRVSGVATGNLLNFVGDGLRTARDSLIRSGVDLPNWSLT
jgi:cyclase